MSSTTIYSKENSLFGTYLVSQDEDKETEGKEEPAEQTPASTYKIYTPKRASFSTVQGRVQRFFA